MGCVGSSDAHITKQKGQLIVATLNYSGILLSPYQFYEKEDGQEKRFSQRMRKLSQIYNLKFQFGPFDKQWQKKRFSPLYLPTCGMKNNVYLLCDQQFRQQWWKVQAQSDNFLLQIFKQQLIKTKQQSQKKKKQKKQKKQESPLKANKLPPIQQKKQVQQKSKQQQQQQNNKLYYYYLNNLCQFDLLIYKAILYEVYTEGAQTKQLDENFNNKDKFQLKAKKYREHRREIFKKSYLDQKLKIQKTIEAIDRLQLDIFFIQEASQQLLSTIQKKKNNFRIVKSCRQNTSSLDSKSVIIIREETFPKIRSLLEQNSRFLQRYSEKNKLIKNLSKKNNSNQKSLRKSDRFSQINTAQYMQHTSFGFVQRLIGQVIPKFNLNSDTVVQVIYNLILICPHLSSRKQKNPAQLQQLQELIRFLKRSYQDCYILVGGDLNNSSLKSFQFQVHQQQRTYIANMNVVPDCQFHFTAHKKRTHMQAQPKKADTVNKQTKDYIITDLEVLQAKIITIDNKIISDSMIPPTPKGNSLFNQTLFGYDANDIKQLPLLPSDNHPYDHYMVITKLKLPQGQQLEHITDASFFFKYHPEKLQQRLYQEQQQRWNEREKMRKKRQRDMERQRERQKSVMDDR